MSIFRGKSLQNAYLRDYSIKHHFHKQILDIGI